MRRNDSGQKIWLQWRLSSPANHGENSRSDLTAVVSSTSVPACRCAFPRCVRVTGRPGRLGVPCAAERARRPVFSAAAAAHGPPRGRAPRHLTSGTGTVAVVSWPRRCTVSSPIRDRDGEGARRGATTAMGSRATDRCQKVTSIVLQDLVQDFLGDLFQKERNVNQNKACSQQREKCSQEEKVYSKGETCQVNQVMREK